MTAPTINGTRYPQPVDELLPAARDLLAELGEVPSRNRLMKQFRIGPPKANALLGLLRAEREQPAAPGPDDVGQTHVIEPVAAEPVLPVRWDYAAPIGPVPAPVVTRRSVRRPRRAPHPVRHRPAVKVPPQPPVVTSPGTAGPDPAGDGEVRSLKRVRWAVRLVLALGVVASIAGNVLHARDEIISQIISAWSPLALLLTIELISRVPVHRRHLAVTRWAATALIAGIAGWVSYWHMATVASRYGETGGAQYLLPLSVDGLVVVASICLVELGGRIGTTSRRRT
ncbi:DUF2637 domain-containing protein [Micromonospora wenchangensis]|uniref:DUF2637 domain-containing protein n=1 Tax=Micromonospora wenchangensis TaxID=1185415 RepID=UPI003805B06D